MVSAVKESKYETRFEKGSGKIVHIRMGKKEALRLKYLQFSLSIFVYFLFHVGISKGI